MGCECNANMMLLLTSSTAVHESKASFHNSTLELKININKVPFKHGDVHKYSVKDVGRNGMRMLDGT